MRRVVAQQVEAERLASSMSRRSMACSKAAVSSAARRVGGGE
jgi:hypothetical protein